VSGRVAAGVDVGGTKALGILVDETGAILATHEVPTPEEGEALLDAVASVVFELASPAELAGVGVGVPGLVDTDGVLRFAPNLRGVVGLGVELGLRRRLTDHGRGRGRGLPAAASVVAGNDANCAGAAELAFGAAKGVSDSVIVTLGTGIGGAIVAGGALLLGANRFAGEIGHMIIDLDGEPCQCGMRGCWERYASGSALGRLARKAAAAGEAPGILAAAGGSVEAIRGEHVTEAAMAGNAEADAVLDEVGFYLAQGLANIAGILDPALFVLSGGMIRAGSALLEPANRHFAALLEGAEHRPIPPIVGAHFGHHAGAIGAAALALGLGGGWRGGSDGSGEHG
jgi:glucokinase